MTFGGWKNLSIPSFFISYSLQFYLKLALSAKWTEPKNPNFLNRILLMKNIP
jgi:hypothetical protein